MLVVSAQKESLAVRHAFYAVLAALVRTRWNDIAQKCGTARLFGNGVGRRDGEIFEGSLVRC